MNVLDELNWRGLIDNCTDPQGLNNIIEKGPITLYAGFDPTADSLHVGNLIPLITLRRFQLFGHKPIALAGGGTGLIGDPSGRSSERQLLSKDTLENNIEKVKLQLKKLLDFNDPNPAILLDNSSWLGKISFLDFLRDVGKHFSVNMMLAKESVRSRMEDRDNGISYTEFSYMLLQAYDFYILKKEHNCDLQIGGSDQWGNITAGIDLCRKKLNTTVYGLTLPLLTNADGTKFGKTIAGAVWLDPSKTSVYKFYQFWIRSDDRDVIKLLKLFTFLSKEEIEDLAHKHTQKPEARDAHKALAKAMTSLIHGPDATSAAIRASEVLYGGALDNIDESTFVDVIGEAPTKHLPKSYFDGDGSPLVDILVTSELTTSKGQARKDIQGGGIYVNNIREVSITRKISLNDFLFGKYLLLRKGKKNYLVISIAD